MGKWRAAIQSRGSQRTPATGRAFALAVTALRIRVAVALSGILGRFRVYRVDRMGGEHLMQIGVVFPQTELGGDVGAVRAYAEGVEQLGYAHLLAYDHVVGADRAVHKGW